MRRRIGRDEIGGGRARGRVAPPDPDVPAHRIGARAPRDREQPCTARRLAAEGRQGADHPHERLLGQVVGVVPTDEMRAVAPHVGLGAAHHGRERQPVAVPRREQLTGQLVHPGRKRTRFEACFLIG